MELLREHFKRKRILRNIKKEITQETLAITKKAGIKKNSPQYLLVEEDVLNGKTFFQGNLYKVPEVDA